METVIAEQLRKNKLLTFRYLQCTSRGGTLQAESIGGGNVTRLQWSKTWGCRVSEHTCKQAVLVCPCEERGKTLFQMARFLSCFWFRACRFGFPISRVFSSTMKHFFYSHSRYVQVAQRLPATLFLAECCTEEIHCVFLLTRTIEVYDMLNFYSCISLAITQGLNNLSVLWEV